MLTIVGAGCAVPKSTRSVEHWRRLAKGCMEDIEITAYRGMTALLFDEINSSVAEHLEIIRQRTAVTDALSFRDADCESQANLAIAAVDDLFQASAGGQDREQCRLAILSTSSVDEAFFQSTVSRVVSEFGLSRVPHFALGQLQGASIIAAIEVVEGMIDADDAAATATLIAAEKWPLPYPRLLPLSAVLGDGAAALSVSRDSSRGGLRVLGTLVESHDPFVEPGGDWEDLGVCMSEKIAAASKRLLNRLKIDVAALSGYIPSGLSREMDREVKANLCASIEFAEIPDVDDGYLGAATTPLLLASLLKKFRAGELAAAATYLVWACSFGGTVAAMVVRTQECGGVE